MRRFRSDNKTLVNDLESLGIKFIPYDDDSMVISDEDAVRVENIVPAIRPCDICEYHISFIPGVYYTVQYDGWFYHRLNTPQGYRWRIICNTLEEARKAFDEELAHSRYRKVEDIPFQPTKEQLDKFSFHLTIDKVTSVDDDEEGDYETILTSEQLFYEDWR